MDTSRIVFTWAFFGVLFFALAQEKKTIVLTDLDLDRSNPAGFVEMHFPSASDTLQGLMYRANGDGAHPTLILLHGYPGNERNLDLAQVVRSKGWHVIYFNYRGAWGSQGDFSFKNCVEDVVNVVNYCQQHADQFGIDHEEIVLFGHSMGGFVTLKALQQLPTIKKGFVLSAWDIGSTFEKKTKPEELNGLIKKYGIDYFVLNTPSKEIFQPVLEDSKYFDLSKDGKSLSEKELMMLDEHNKNEHIADALSVKNTAYFDYQVWDTDHSFTNKRVSLMNAVLDFLQKP